MNNTVSPTQRIAIKGFIGVPNTNSGRLFVEVPTDKAKRIKGFSI